jgi:hypothetical protein
MMTEHLVRSISKELHRRVELIDTLIEEAEQKIGALHHALGVQTHAKAEIQHDQLATRALAHAC